MEQHGGALFIQTYCTATIINCYFFDNHAADDGGAIYIKISSRLNVSNSCFERNNAEDSGGSLAIEDSTVVISFSLFQYESVISSYGGSICALDAGYITIIHTQFINCTANIGGALSVMLGSNLDIQHSSIMYCVSNVTAGALYVYCGGKVKSSNVSFHNCEAQSGGAILVDHLSSLFLNHSLINSSFALSGDGGGIFCRDSNIELHDCIISKNIGFGQGGGIYEEKCRTSINNISFDMNAANVYGGGLFSVSSIVSIHNSKAQNNYALNLGRLMFLKGSTLICQHFQLIDNMTSSGNIIAIIDSHADMKYLHLIHDAAFCPLVVSSKSHFNIEGYYGTNNTNGITSQNETIVLKGHRHLCTDISSQVGENSIQGTHVYEIS